MWIRRLIIVKITVLPKLIYRLNAIPIKILVDLFVKTDKLILKFIWKCKGSRIAKTILRKNSKVRGTYTTQFQDIFKATVIKIV